jgi:hypothetical protein
VLKFERRKHDRYLSPPNTFAVLGKKFSRAGKVKEIGQGGLSLEYISDESPINDASQVEIFLAGNGFHLSGVSCQLIYDITLSSLTEKYHLPFITKKCGLSFQNPTIEQHNKIKGFIETHNLALLQDR